MVYYNEDGGQDSDVSDCDGNEEDEDGTALVVCAESILCHSYREDSLQSGYIARPCDADHSCRRAADKCCRESKGLSAREAGQ